MYSDRLNQIVVLILSSRTWSWRCKTVVGFPMSLQNNVDFSSSSCTVVSWNDLSMSVWRGSIKHRIRDTAPTPVCDVEVHDEVDRPPDVHKERASEIGYVTGYVMSCLTRYMRRPINLPLTPGEFESWADSSWADVKPSRKSDPCRGHGSTVSVYWSGAWRACKTHGILHAQGVLILPLPHVLFPRRLGFFHDGFKECI